MVINHTVPSGFEVIYVLTSGDGLVIQNVSATPSFTVNEEGLFTIHTLVYDPNTLDLGIVEPGVTTGFDVNSLLIQGGGDICAALDVPGAKFEVENCKCKATAGTLKPNSEECIDDHGATITAKIGNQPTVPSGFEVIYVLTSGDGLVIQNVSAAPSFTVNEEGLFTIHTLVYNPSTLDLGIVEIGATTGFDVNSLLIQGGGDICAALDVPGAKFMVEACKCEATSGSLRGGRSTCLANGEAILNARRGRAPIVPDGYERIYVLTSGEDLIIENVNDQSNFTVDAPGIYTIHTLVYDPNTLDLGIVQIGVTTGFDVNSLLIQGGGSICAALDVAGTTFEVKDCTGNIVLNIRPNPAHETMKVDIFDAEETETVTIQIIDSFGKIQRSVEVDGGSSVTAELNILNLEAGTYFIKAIYDNKGTRLRTFVKQ